MSFTFKPAVRVFLYNEAIDMRSGFTKLSALVTEKMKSNIFEGNVFLFLGHNRRRVKMLLFDGTGLVLITKRLDRAKFMALEDLCNAEEIGHEDLARLLDGANLRVVFAAAKRLRQGEEVA